MNHDQLHLQASFFEVILQTKEHLLTFFLLIFYFSMKIGELRGENMQQFEQVTKQSTETDKAT